MAYFGTTQRGQRRSGPPLSAVGHRISDVKIIETGRGTVSDPLAVLTPRERDVLRLVADGCSTKMIAAALNLSVNTVNNHRAAIHAKLGVHSATAAAKLYWVEV